MDFIQFMIAVPWFGGGLLLWPTFLIFRGHSDARSRPLRTIFFVTLAATAALSSPLGIVMLLGKFNHNWLPLTLLFPLINLASIAASIFIWSRRDYVA
jgi:hypothetical protein